MCQSGKLYLNFANRKITMKTYTFVDVKPYTEPVLFDWYIIYASYNVFDIPWNSRLTYLLFFFLFYFYNTKKKANKNEYYKNVMHFF